ncbi:hypothetical protein F511_31250 [Dorcoceras hygrometricum]|uniref:Uncharacterized protein n=1 Tax=Dorcoceras hygrometricum TaxID=472368 RepID=A0A2Z7DJN1_9LAMI|nr:hypothetical protein F511_31250 [Dorcoceras hygrometricum]
MYAGSIGVHPLLMEVTFRVVRTNQYNRDLGLIHSTNGNHLESSNEGSSIDHQDLQVAKLDRVVVQLVDPCSLESQSTFIMY